MSKGDVHVYLICTVKALRNSAQREVLQVCLKGVVGGVLTPKCLHFLWEFTHTRRDNKDEVIPSGAFRAGQSYVMLCPALFGSGFSINNSIIF